MLDAANDRPAPLTPSSSERPEVTPDSGASSQEQAGGVGHRRSRPLHTADADCTVGDDLCCIECGVSHGGEACAECRGVAFHRDGCSQIEDAREPAATSPFPCYCDVRILHVSVPSGLASVTVRYVVATEGGESWMGEADVWVCEVGSGDGYDFSTHFERTTRGHEIPQSLHGIIEEAAEAAWAAGLGGERALDAHNAELTASYLHWREVEALDLFLAETTTAAGCR